MGLTGFRGRMIALAAVIATLAAAVLVLASYLLLGRVIDDDAHTLARARAQAVASIVTVRAGQVVLTENSNESLDAVVWLYADGRLIDGVVPPELVGRVQELAASTQAVSRTVADSLLYAEPVAVDHHHVVVVVRVDLTPYETSQRHALTMSLIVGGLTVALAGAVAFIVVRRALRVVHEMAALADDWSEHDPDRRFNLGEPRDEFGELGRTLDHLLDRVEKAIQDERRLTDEIAHELRTPLTVLRGEAQLAHLSATSLDSAVVLREVERLNSAVTTILAAARRRLDATAGSCNLRAALMQSIAGRQIELHARGDVVVETSHEIVVSIMSPLLDNAVRHAHSYVQVRVLVVSGRVIVDVLDDGSGFSPDQVQHVFDPGVTNGAGHGLGLTLVRRVASAAGIDVRAISDGGGHVQVIFPMLITAP